MKKINDSYSILIEQLKNKETIIVQIGNDSILRMFFSESMKALGLCIGIAIGLAANVSIYHFTHGALGFSI